MSPRLVVWEVWAVLRFVVSWSWRYRRAVAVVVGWSALLQLATDGEVPVVAVLAACWWVPLLALALWSRLAPVSFERLVGGPLRRLRWRRWARKGWPEVARRCGLSTSEAVERHKLDGQVRKVTRWHHPRLVAVVTDDARLSLTVRARLGQTSEDLEAAGPVIRDAAGARSVRATPAGPGTVRLDLVMRDQLTTTLTATMPQASADELPVEEVPVGRTETGQDWRLRLDSRHTLIAGASDSGKGSLVWGVVGNLAPAIHAGLVRVYGIDLKYGVEVSIGRGLFAAVATTEPQAVALLSRLDELVRRRGEAMAGHTRKHTPRRGDPFVVLVIDELASLTGYMTDKQLQKEADRLLRSILSKGRAMGVVVVGALQDPRKETLPARGLFTQTIALRLRSKEEVAMVLGEGTGNAAPAHRIDPATPGMGYVQHEDGRTVRVRAPYWPDQLIRDIAARYPAEQDRLPAPSAPATPPETGSASRGDAARSQGGAGGRRPRSPRAPRNRTGARTSPTDGGEGGEAA